MRYLMSARLRSGKAPDLLRALEDGSFGRGFPYGDLGAVLKAARVDERGTLRWLEVCYCREYYGVAMEEELPFLEPYLTDMTVGDARNPKGCKGYPECSDCACTGGKRLEGTPFMEWLRRLVQEGAAEPASRGDPTRWLGWRGKTTPEEARRSGGRERSQDVDRPLLAKD
jgi:hypothetical protein